MLTEKQIKEMGFDLELDDKYGYVVKDWFKTTCKINGNTKMCSYDRFFGNNFQKSELLPTYHSGDEIPTAEITVQAYMDNAPERAEYKLLSGSLNTSPHFKELIENLGISNYEDCVINFSDSANPEFITKMFAENDLSIKDQFSDKLDVQINPLTMVYSTALPKEINEQLITEYFSAIESLDDSYEVEDKFNFISTHRNDLMKCLGGREQLIEFAKGQWDLGQELIDELVDELNQYTPEEIMDGIDVRQAEMKSIVSETNKISKESPDKGNNENNILK